ncbi:proteasome assembly chaperone family protein [Haloparvum sp. PAK95]|uniref:proteasome assembly chaperone family protein n=1 Tax=Haloparvum sp. PAK95 TaxID=3418962 RepID=UPI003D2ECE79
MDGAPTLDVEITAQAPLGDVLVVGVADPGVAGLSATDHLVSALETTQVGHVSTRHLPDLTPFSEGRPRHPIRLYTAPAADLTILVGEVFLPVGIADQFADALTEWVATTGIDEITVVHGAPFQHAETDHVVSHVATDEYRARHFDSDGTAVGDDAAEAGASGHEDAEAGTSGEDVPGEDTPGDDTPGDDAPGQEIPPLSGGFFDGVLGELLVRGMEGDLPPVGVLVTPSHPPGPDLDGALRLLGSLRTVYGVDVDETDLRRRADEMRQYYRELSERMQSLRDGEEGRRGEEYPHDRMYM